MIAQVEKAWGLTIRDGYGQTEMTAAVGNTPGSTVKPGSMGRPLPGCPVVVVDPITNVLVTEPDSDGNREGEICLDLSQHPVPLMTGYQGDEQRNADAMAGGFYHTGDVASVDADGYITFVGRTDDVFKASDYKISPFEVESVLIEHPAVAEAAVVPAPDPVRLAVPKAYIALAAGPRARRGRGALDPRPRPREAGAVAAGATHRVLRAAEDDLGQDPPGRAAWPGERARRGRCRRSPRTSGATTSSPTSRGDAVERGRRRAGVGVGSTSDGGRGRGAESSGGSGDPHRRLVDAAARSALPGRVAAGGLTRLLRGSAPRCPAYGVDAGAVDDLDAVVGRAALEQVAERVAGQRGQLARRAELATSKA